MMTRILSLAALLAALALPASADCYADYKAKQDDPLRLHYGVIALPEAACGGTAQAEPEIADRIAVGGWTLLRVVRIFGEDGLEKRKARAGEFFLRY